MKILYLPVSYKKERAKQLINKLNQDADNTQFINDIETAALLDKEQLAGLMMISDNISDAKHAEIIGVGMENYQKDVITPVDLETDMDAETN